MINIRSIKLIYCEKITANVPNGMSPIGQLFVVQKLTNFDLKKKKSANFGKLHNFDNFWPKITKNWLSRELNKKEPFNIVIDINSHK